jgi:hypothetical protein
MRFPDTCSSGQMSDRINALLLLLVCGMTQSSPEACLRVRHGAFAQPEFRIACFCLITLAFFCENSRSLCLLAVGRPLLSAPEIWICQNYTRGDVEILAVSLDLNTGDVLSGHGAADRSSAASVHGHTIALQPCQQFSLPARRRDRQFSLPATAS